MLRSAVTGGEVLLRVDVFLQLVISALLRQKWTTRAVRGVKPPSTGTRL